MFQGRTKATDIGTDGDGVTAVVTDLGRVAVEQVLVATDNWAPLFDRMFGMTSRICRVNTSMACTSSHLS